MQKRVKILALGIGIVLIIVIVLFYQKNNSENNLKCPEDYASQEKYLDSLAQWIKQKQTENPNMTLNEIEIARTNYLRDNNCQRDKAASQSENIYYGYIGYNPKDGFISSDDDIFAAIAKFTDPLDCVLWVNYHQNDGVTIESKCIDAKKDKVDYESLFRMEPANNIYLSFADGDGFPVVFLPLSKEPENSSILSLTLKRWLESVGVADIKIIYYTLR